MLASGSRSTPKTLFFAYPGINPLGPSFNAGWSHILARMMRSLVAAGWDCKLVTGKRFAESLNPYSDLELCLVDDIKLHQTLASEAPEAGCASVVETGCRLEHEIASAAATQLMSSVRSAVCEFEPDLIIEFGSETPALRQLWPEATVLYSETSAFSRDPFPLSVYFDHVGLHGRSTPCIQFNDIVSLPATSGDTDFLADFRRQSKERIAKQNPFSTCDFRERFSKLVLLPLQVSSYYSFDEVTQYRTQFEYLFDILVQTPPDVGLIASEYIQWGPVINEEGSRSNRNYLTKTFPNLIALPRFRRFHSSSPFLAATCDGVWSVASNLGLQTKLFGKYLGSASNTLNGLLADSDDVGSFFELVKGNSPEPTLCEALLAWYLKYYAVPFALIEDADWFTDYLTRRISAIEKAPNDPCQGFARVVDNGSQREYWLDKAPLNPIATTYESNENRLQQQWVISGLEAAKAKLVNYHNTPSIRRADHDGGYILLNETSFFDDGLHLGCNLVTRSIQTRMAEAGFECLATANVAAECNKLLESDDLTRAKIAIFNGEGTLHHDSARAEELMQFCRQLKELGIPSVLINSVWRENTQQLAQYLPIFDFVTVRESRSLEEIRPWRNDATIVPDLTFDAFAQELERSTSVDSDSTAQKYDCTVIDNVLAERSDSLFDFAEFHRFPFYCMGKLHPWRLATYRLGPIQIEDEVFPQILIHSNQLTAGRSCVTGRFHGAVASLNQNIPTFCIPSNTPKTEGMLSDIGISQQSMLPIDWLEQGNFRRLKTIEDRTENWDERTKARVSGYADDARRSIGEMFTDIIALATPAPTFMQRITSALSNFNR